MATSLERLSDLERRMKASLLPEEIDQEVDKRLQKLATSIRMDGFRRGHVPKKVVTQKFGDSVRGEVVGEKIESNLNKVFEQENVRPVSTPRVEIVRNQSGQAVEFVATFEVYPEIKFDVLANLTLEEKTAEINEEDVDRVIKRWQQMSVKWNKVDRASQKDDRVVISYQTLVDGHEVKDGNADNMPIVLGSHSLLKEFEEGLAGVKAEQSLNLSITLPETHPNKEVAGKKADLNVKVHSVEAPELPEVNDEFCARHGVDEGGVARLREEIKTSLGTQLKRAVLKEMKAEFFDKVGDLYDFALPQSLVQQEQNALAQRNQQMKAKPLSADELKTHAEKAVRLGLLLGQFINDNAIQPDDERVNESLVEMTYQYGGTEEIYKMLRANKDLVNRLKSSILEDQAVEKMLELVKKTPIVSTFADILKIEDHMHDEEHVHGPDCNH